MIEHAVVIAKKEEITPKDLPQNLFQKTGESGEPMTLQEFEKALILKTLREVDWNKHKAAKKLKITRSTLYGKIRRYGLSKD